MPAKTSIETRAIDGYQLVIERSKEMSLPFGGGLEWIVPAISITVYRPSATGAATPNGDSPPAARLLRHVFPQPSQTMSKAEQQEWSERCLARLLTLLAAPVARSEQAPDRLAPGIYSTKEAPYLYLIENARPREGYTEALVFNARSGGDVRPTLVDTSSLEPVRNLISQDWQRELQTFQPANSSRRSPEHIAGCLLGGAIGDALGAGIRTRSLVQIRAQFGAAGLSDYAPIAGAVGTLSWHSQMCLFTAEGLIRAKRRSDEKGICDVVGVVLHAYYRWLATQGEALPERAAAPTEADGWLVTLTPLHARRGPSPTVLSALGSGQRGALAKSINTSKGAGALARIAPVGIARLVEPFNLGTEIAALTHGHATGYLAAGCFAALADQLMGGATLADALEAASTALRQAPKHEECLQALTRAQQHAAGAPATPESVEQLGQGASAEQALAIAVFCALKAESFEHGVRLAVNHSGASDLTGALAGQLLGALHGRSAIPARWLAPLELRDAIAELANDMFLEFGQFPQAAWFAAKWDKYPGW